MTAEFAVAIHSVVFLCHKKKYVSSSEIADNVCTNPARIRKIMNKLISANIVETKNGVGGGYIFSLKPSEVNLFHILTALDEKIVFHKWHSGDKNKHCQVAFGMDAVTESIYNTINIAGYEILKKITIEDIIKTLFPNGEEKANICGNCKKNFI